ncbi:MAC/perforin domain-containing protein [Mucilaginibacter sp. FT3.2]|uniref:MAC/perforin domain-containing protein n=1 Tax=Mucilaginibacter sp. FT3.2 TaxID=2723090 RepID=UPI00161F3592|nr:MAC/perforin domain-containing protein [Mucilaginibacter sp. FT3.2]MBB6232322.1 hypothetical protein [Mucilaginibacter sp. FT3.2]
MTTLNLQVLQEQIEQSKPQDFVLQSFNAFNPIIAKNPDLLLSQLNDYLKTPLTDSEVNTQTVKQTFSSTFKEFQSSQSSNTEFAASVGIEGSYGFYSGSVKASYSSETYQASTAFSSSFNAVINCGTVTFKRQSDNNAIRACLTTEFCDNLDNITTLKAAEAFVNTYGTHLVLGLNLGGFIQIKSESQTSNYKSKQEMSLAVTAAYEGIGSISATATATQKLSQESFSSGLQQSVDTAGGQSSLAASIDPKDPKTVTDWASSCTSETSYGITSSVETWQLATNDTAKNTLKQYINIVILAQSINNPTILAAEAPLQPYTIVNVTAIANDAHFRIIGGGAILEKNKSSFLVNSYPQTDSRGHINGWTAGTHDIATPASADEYITAFAMAIYDPSYTVGGADSLLQVQFKTATGSNQGIGGDTASIAVDADYLLSGGGIHSFTTGNINKYVVGSYPSDDFTWTATNHDYEYAAYDVALTAYAIGIKSNHPSLTITQSLVSTPESESEYGNQTAKLGNDVSIAGGGVSVTNATDSGSLVQQSFPSSSNSWTEYNKDDDGHVSYADSVAYAIGFTASLDFDKQKS